MRCRRGRGTDDGTDDDGTDDDGTDDDGTDDDGMVTAELAACLPVLVLLLAVALTAVSAVGARVRLQDAAREAARSVARGDPGEGRRLAEQAAPGAAITLSRGSDSVVAIARIRVHPLGDFLPAFTVRERAVAAREPTAGGP